MRILALSAAIFAAFAANAGTVEYRFGRACISHEAGAVEYYTPNRPTRGGSALFLIPAPYETPSRTDPASRTGLAVRFLWVSDLSYKARIRSRAEETQGRCVEKVFGHGLVTLHKDPHFKPKGARTCAALNSQETFVPEVKEIPLRIVCTKSPASVGACSMSYFLSNGWEAKILLPKATLPEWKNAAALSKSFFQDSIKICD